MSAPGEFKVGGVTNMPGDIGVIVIGLNETMLSLPLTAIVIRRGIKNALDDIVKMAKTHVVKQMRVKGHLYWTGALRRSVKSYVIGSAIKLGGNITGVISAGSSSVWYAYKVHEIGRGWGHYGWRKKGLIEGFMSAKRGNIVGITHTGGYTWPPIPYMKLAWAETKPNAVPIMCHYINKALSSFMGTLL